MAPVQSSSNFLTGIVEGFYGQAWSWDTRHYYATQLPRWQCNSYLYAPKADGYLRRNWMQPLPGDHHRRLGELAGDCAAQGVRFGVGLSPFELYRDYSAGPRAQLRRKIQQLNTLEADLLAILFDDMPGELPELAARQAEIVADVAAWSNVSRLMVCPTYYTTDPVLEQVFGTRPPDYWSELGARLDSTIDLLWTGPQVCSERITVRDAEEAALLLGRPVTLWDNYPVNDGARMSRFLHLRPLAGRAAGLRGATRGHLCNPMNQGRLSALPLQGLAALYADDADDIRGWADEEFGRELAGLLATYEPQLQDQGLDGLGEQSCCELARRFAAITHPAAAEVAAWLRGEYTFDPACLTD